MSLSNGKFVELKGHNARYRIWFNEQGQTITLDVCITSDMHNDKVISALLQKVKEEWQNYLKWRKERYGF